MFRAVLGGQAMAPPTPSFQGGSDVLSWTHGADACISRHTLRSDLRGLPTARGLRSLATRLEAGKAGWCRSYLRKERLCNCCQLQGLHAGLAAGIGTLRGGCVIRGTLLAHERTERLGLPDRQCPPCKVCRWKFVNLGRDQHIALDLEIIPCRAVQVTSACKDTNELKSSMGNPCTASLPVLDGAHANVQKVGASLVR